MPQPAAVTEPVERLLQAWLRAQGILEAEADRVRLDIANAPTRERRRAFQRRLARIETELLATVETEMARLRALTSEYLSGELPAAWKAGAQVANPSAFVWSVPHRTGLTAMVNDTWSDVLGATDYVTGDVKRFLGELGSSWSELRFTAGISPQEARREFLRGAKAEGIKGVRYKDGSRRTIGDYGDMLLRTKQATAYQRGVLTESRELGFTHVRLFDGPDCSLFSHTDGPLANNLVVPLDVADAYPLAHPRCVRGSGPVTVPAGTAADAMFYV